MGNEAANETRETDVLIIGAGFAGAATAFHLTRQFQGRVLIVEKEAAPGLHASGRNASLLFQPAAPEPIRQLLIRSRRAYEENRAEIRFRQHGSLLLGREEEVSKLVRDTQVGSRTVSPDIVKQRVPILSGHDFEAALWTESDGVIDIARLLEFYLAGARERGAALVTDCEVLAVEKASPYRLKTSLGIIHAGRVINAAGAWAGPLGRLFEAADIPLFPLKRHLFILEGMPINMEEGPFVWDVEDNFYFRPEAGGLLFCICDEEPSQSLIPTISPEIREQLAEVIWKHLPRLRDAVQREAWSCFRTKTSDGLFAVGWDPRRDDFFWVAGLGGNGMGTSWAVGEEAASSFLKGRDPNNPMDPGRWLENQ